MAYYTNPFCWNVILVGLCCVSICVEELKSCSIVIKITIHFLKKKTAAMWKSSNKLDVNGEIEINIGT